MPRSCLQRIPFVKHALIREGRVHSKGHVRYRTSATTAVYAFLSRPLTLAGARLEVDMIRCRAVVPAVCLALACWSSPVFAWNIKGHMTVGYLAYKRLTPQARARADQLLQLNPFYPQWVREIPATLTSTDRSLAIFMIATTWADQIKSDRGYRDDGTAGGNRPDGPASSYNIGYPDTLRHRY